MKKYTDFQNREKNNGSLLSQIVSWLVIGGGMFGLISLVFFEIHL